MKHANPDTQRSTRYQPPMTLREQLVSYRRRQNPDTYWLSVRIGWVFLGLTVLGIVLNLFHLL